MAHVAKGWELVPSIGFVGGSSGHFTWNANQLRFHKFSKSHRILSVKIYLMANDVNWIVSFLSGPNYCSEGDIMDRGRRALVHKDC